MLYDVIVTVASGERTPKQSAVVPPEIVGNGRLVLGSVCFYMSSLNVLKATCSICLLQNIGNIQNRVVDIVYGALSDIPECYRYLFVSLLFVPLFIRLGNINQFILFYQCLLCIFFKLLIC